jgi:hypothetical protein
MTAGDSTVRQRRANEQQRSGNARPLWNSGQSIGPTLDPPATDQKGKIPCTLIGFGARAIRLVKRRAEPTCR